MPSGERLGGAGSSDLAPCIGDLLCPLPSRVYSEFGGAGSSGDSGGHVQDTVAEGIDFAAGQIRVIGEADQLGPGNQVGGRGDDLEPGGVRVETVAGQISQPGEPTGHHRFGGVGDERSDPVSVGIGEGQLGTGVGAFLAQQQPGSCRPRTAG